MRLRDLILAFNAQHDSACALLQRIDPATADELRAFAAYRRVNLLEFVAHCLEHLAAEAADTIWQLGIERRVDFENDPEAALLGDVLQKAVTTRLQREHVIASETMVYAVSNRFNRFGHPYTMA